MSQGVSGKASFGANSRVGPQKAHIPYRGDDLEHGKKTGKTVNQVSRDADDFEPFEQVLDQAYKGNNVPRPANNEPRTSRRELSPIQDDGDSSGELSMDIDSTHNSPSVYFNAANAPQPSSAKQVGSSLRPLPRGSNIDYDSVPSPRAVPRRSSAHPGTSSRPLHPSRLRKEVQDDDDDDDGVARGPIADLDRNSFTSVGIDDGDYPNEDGYPVDQDASTNSRNNLSFTALAQDEDEDMEENMEDEVSPVSSRADKGKKRAEAHDPNDEEDGRIEDGIAASLQDIENTYENDEQDEPGPSKKSWKNKDKATRGSEPSNKRLKKSQIKRMNEGQRISIYDTLDEDGLRRSKRLHYPPLEYWRQEKVVWGRRENGRSVVPVIKKIITIPKPAPEPLGAKKRKRGGTRPPRSKSAASANSPVEEVHVVEVDNPELGWDDNTVSEGIILDWYSHKEVFRRVAYPARMVAPKAAQGNKYRFQKIFGDGNFMAAGHLIIPPGEEKPMKPAKDNTYIFYVIQGAVECKIYRTTFVMATGGMFMVPRGNTYYIKNICDREAKIFFSQARRIQESDQDVMPDVLPRTARARTAPRSSSHGAPSPKQSASATQDTGTARPEI